MRIVKQTTRYRKPAFTLVEMILVVGMLSVVGTATVGLIRASSEDFLLGSRRSNLLQEGRATMAKMVRTLRQVSEFTTLSGPSDTTGSVTFIDNEGDSRQFQLDSGVGEIQYGEVASLSTLCGSVTSLTFTCYDEDAATLSDPVTVADIRSMKIDFTITDGTDSSISFDLSSRVYWPLNSTSILLTSPVGWWKLDDGGGTTASDFSSNGHDGTLTNMGGTEWTEGMLCGALDFDGNNDYITVANDSTLQPTAALTIAAWIKGDAWGSGSSVDAILRKGDSTPVNYQLCVADQKVMLSLDDYDASGIRGDTTLNTGQWYHVAATWDGSNVRIYVNGLLDNDPPDTRSGTIGTDTRSVRIGGRSGADYFDGVIDDVRFYNSALSAEEIAQLADVLRYREFTETKVGTAATAITLTTPGGSGATVSLLGSWTSGLTHTAESGSDRLLIFTAHGEDSSSVSLNSVTYGGQSMTKAIEGTQEDSVNVYIAVYVLDEAGISAASSSTFSVSWSSTPEDVGYSSVFLSNVDQIDPVGANDSDGSTNNNTVSTGALATTDGDMVIVAATAGNEGSYSVNNGFAEAIELYVSTADAVAGYKSADGSNETPSVTHSNPYRQVIIGFVVQGGVGGTIETIESDLLIAAVATDGDTSSSLSPPGGENWTQISIDSQSSDVTLGAWWKVADASESGSHQFTWTGDEQAYGWMMRVTGQHTTNPIADWTASGQSSSSPTSPAVTPTSDGSLILRLGAFDNDDITVDGPGLLGHTAITMDKSATSASGTVSYEEFSEAKLDYDGTSLTISTPSSTEESDLLIAAVVTDDDRDSSLSPPGGEGWTEIDLDDHDNSVTLGVWWKLAEASESSTHQFSWSGGSESYGWIMRFTGHHASSPIHTWSATGGVDSSSPYRATSPSVTTTIADCLILRISGIEDDDVTIDDTGLDNGYTDITMDESGSGSGTCSGGAGFIQQSSIGSSGTATFDQTDNEPYRTVTIAIAPNTSVGGTVSGGAGYTMQCTSGDSGTSAFSLDSASEATTLTIAIAPGD